MAITILRVSQLNKYIKSILESDTKLKELYVKGEISDFKVSYNGHAYFSLKDDSAVIRCVMFGRNMDFLRFFPKNGDSVLARGYGGFYEKNGTFSLYVSDLSAEGEGQISQKQEILKVKLENLGYFSQKNKKKLPTLPKTVGIVTSLTGAAIGDILKTLRERCPFINIIISPATVQGDYSQKTICDAVSLLNADGRSDVIIIGRGGGSTEDLSVFNTEEVVKAVFASNIPTISAVGHEKDLSFCDLTADLRAATPTAAAQLAVPLVSNLNDRLSVLSKKLNIAFLNSIESKKQRLSILYKNPYISDFNNIIDNKVKVMDTLKNQLAEELNLKIEKNQSHIVHLISMLDAVSPLKVLKRGYAVVEKNKITIDSVKDLHVDENLDVKFSDGEIKVVVADIKGVNNYDL